jgi:tetratricopeptide (TPR) repeat protein
MASLLPTLTQLESAGLIRPVQPWPEATYLFRHGLVQEAAYASLLKQQRREVHRAVGEALETLHPDSAQSGETAATLARHFAEAGDDERALYYLTAAGDAAARVYANSEAVAHYSEAIEIGMATTAAASQIEHLFLRRGRAFELNGNYEAALENYVALEAAARQRGDARLELAGLVQRALLYALPVSFLDASRAIALSEPALELARQLGERQAEARIFWIMLLAHMAAGRLEQAIAAGEESLRLARQLDATEQLGYTLTDLSRAYMGIGRGREAQHMLLEAQQVWQALGNQPMLAESITNEGSLHFFSGHYEQALQPLTRGLHISRSIHNAWGEAYSLMILAFVSYERGEFGAAMAHAEACLAASESAGFIYSALNARAVLALLYGILGLPERGLAQLELAEQLSMGPQMASEQAVILAVRALLLVRQDRAIEAEPVLAQARQLYNPEDHYSFAPVLITLAEGEVSLLHARYEHAAEIAANLLNLLERHAMGAFVPEARLLRARALRALNRADEARVELDHARQAAQRSQAQLVLWPIQRALGDLESDAGNQAAAQRPYAEARRSLQFILESIDEPALLRAFIAQPEVQATLAAQAHTSSQKSGPG